MIPDELFATAAGLAAAALREVAAEVGDPAVSARLLVQALKLTDLASAGADAVLEAEHGDARVH